MELSSFIPLQEQYSAIFSIVLAYIDDPVFAGYFNFETVH